MEGTLNVAFPGRLLASADVSFPAGRFMPERTHQPSLPGLELEPEAAPRSTALPTARLAAAGTGSPADAARPASLHGQTVWVIDAHALVHQVFHALPEMSSPRGEPVGAVFGFTRDLLFLLENKKPDFLFCAVDLPGKTFRHAMFEQYKANRKEMPEDLVGQIAAIHRVVEALGIPQLACESYEADDVLATVARITEEMDGHCYLVTADKDCRQLITDRVKLYNIRKDQVFDRDALGAEWGITPAQVIDFQALVGDSVDNVPGVPLIGPKLARQLLQHYGTLEQVLEHAHEVPGEKRRQNLIEGREQALRSRELLRLNAHVPLRIDWEAGRSGRIDYDRTVELFREFGFRSLTEKMESMRGQSPGPTPARRATHHLLTSLDALQTLVSRLAQQKQIAVDLETTSVWPRWAEIVGYSLAWREDESWYVPVRAPAGECRLDAKQTADLLRPVLENPAIEKVGQNLKYDMIVLRSVGIELSGVAFDTMVASYLLDAGQRNHNLDDLAKRYLHFTTTKIAELIGSGKNQKRMDEVPLARIAAYAGDDAMLPLRLRPILAKRLASEQLEKLYTELELPLIDVLVELEYNGIKVDVVRLRELSERYGQEMEALQQQIYDLAGHRFNIASPKQLQEVLFEELKLPKGKKTKTGPSTDAEVLEELARLHPLPAKIIEYRQYAKLKSTYVDALPKMVHPQTGRVHASFHQAVAATGRLSSSDPNLQNIPVRDEVGREIRGAFVPGCDGWLLLAADYSQIELRVLAHFSRDQRLCEAFAQDEDIHARVASQIYGVPPNEVTASMRRQAKAVNFGVIYGQSPFGLAKQLGIDQDEAAKFIDAYFEGYPGVEQFLNQVLETCYTTGCVATILGRRRAIQGVRRGAGRQRNLAERTAINTVIQGSAADLIKKAMIAIHRRLRHERLSARMLLQIHDELVFETPSTELEPLVAIVREEMSSAHPLDVRLKVDVKTGPSWGQTEPWSK